MKRNKLYLFAAIGWIAYSLHAFIVNVGSCGALIGAPFSNPDVRSLFLELLLKLVLPIAGGVLLTVHCLRRWKGILTKGLVLIGLLLLAADALVFGIFGGNVFVHRVSIVYGAMLILYALQMGGLMGGTKWPSLIALAVVGTVLGVAIAFNQTVFPYVEIETTLLSIRVVSNVFWISVEWIGYLLLTITANRIKSE